MSEVPDKDPEFEYKATTMANEVRDGRVPERTPLIEALEKITNGYAALGWRTVSMTHVVHDVSFIFERKIPKNPFDRYDSWKLWLAWETQYHPDQNPYHIDRERDQWHAWEDERSRRG